MAFANKPKATHKKSAFKSFGNFLALHMVKRLVRRNKSNQVSNDLNQTEKEALDAGFDANNFSNESSTKNDISLHRSNSTTAATALNVISDKDRFPNGSLTNNTIAVNCPPMPGVFGLTNHGNTCFINSVAQCLSNTDLLAEYFVMGQYKHDMKNCRKDRSKKYGTKGEVTEQMAVIIRSLWMGLYSPEMTKTLKEVIGKYALQYKGSIQHDSQEFLLWLFDKMHEDLNMQPLKKKNFVRKQSFRKIRKGSTDNTKVNSDKLVKATDLSPNSFIQKTFQGHYHSSLTCPTCKKKSETVDPYLCVSLPLKQRTTRPIYVNVVYLPNKRRSATGKKSLNSRTIKIGVSVDIDEKVYNLRQAVAGECGIHSRLLAFADLRNDGFHESFGDNRSISDIPFFNSNNASCVMSLYAFEMPPHSKMTAGTLPRNFASRHKKRSFGSVKHYKESELSDFSSTSNSDNIIIILINKKSNQEKGKRFGRPIVFQTSRDVSMIDLQSTILSQIGDQLKNGFKHDRVGLLFQLQIIDGLPNKSYLTQQAQKPLRLPTVDKAIENSPSGSPCHIKLVAEWNLDTKTGVFEKFPEEKVEHQESVRLQKLLHQQPVTCTLQECFDLHTEDEELEPEEGWMCPHCNKVQHKIKKKLSLYTLPDIFVVHLKRFRVENGKRTKLTTRVEFPVTGLDMSKHIHSDGPSSPLLNKQWNNSSSSNNRKYMPANPDDTLYDLYAVCNHYGNMNSGHYTACCCNPLDGRWYLFDDEQTECIKENKLSPQSVYLLFYQRRSSSVALSCGGASINSVMSDHWSYSLPQIRQRIEFNSQSHLNRHAVAMNRVKSFAAVQNKPAKKGTAEDPKQSTLESSALLQRNVNNNSLKIAAAIEEHKKGRGDAAPDDDSDDGGFASTSRPYAKGLRRQGSAVVPRTQKHEMAPGSLGGRHYRSHRHVRPSRTQRSSHV